MRNGSPPAVHRGRASFGGFAPEAKRFLEFKLNFVHIIQQDKLKVGLFLKVEISNVP